MKHPLLILCGLVVVILFTALIAPFLINWTAYRAEIENEAGKILGRQVSINGDIDIRLLPSGVIRFGRVEVKSPDDPHSAALASIELVKARLALAPLLRGKFQFTDIELVRPTFRFDVSLQGVPNWQIGTDSNFGGLIAPGNIIFDDVLISGGSVFFRDARRRVAYDVSNIHARVSARALVGPYMANGNLVFAGQKHKFSLRAGKANDKNVRRISLRLIVPDKEDEQISFDGFLDTSDQGPRFDGKMTLNQDISKFRLFKSMASGSKERFFGKIEADIATSFVGIRLEGIRAVISHGTATARLSGRAQVLWQDSSEFIIELTSKRLDLDKLFNPAPASKTPDQKTPGPQATDPQEKPDKKRPPVSLTTRVLGLMADALPGLWRHGFDGRISLKADAVVFEGQTIEEAALKLRFADNHIEVQEASGKLPGRSKLIINGFFLSKENVTRFDGSFGFKSANAKDFARWLVPSLSPLMGPKLSGHNGILSVNGNLKVGPKSIDLLDMDVKLDDSQATAGLSYALRKRPAFGLALSIDQIDFDRYFPPDQLKPQVSQVEFAGSGFIRDVADLFMRFDANIRLYADRLTSRGITTRGFAADVGLEAGKLTINKLDIADIGGGSLTTKGSIIDINGKPTGMLEASLVAPDPTDLFDLLGIGGKNSDNSDNSWTAKSFGPLNIGVSFEASFKDNQPHRLIKVTGSAGGTKLSSQMLLLGKLSDIAHSRLDFTAEAVNEDGARLLSQLGWLKPGLAKTSSQAGVLRARIKGDVNQRLEVGFGLQAYGVRANLSGNLVNTAGEPLLEADVTMESEDIRPLLSVLKTPAKTSADDILPLAFHGLLSAKKTEFVLTGFSGSVGKTPVNITGTMTLGGPVPKIKATIQTEEISFPWMFNALFGGDDKVETDKDSNDQVWSAQPFDFSRLKAADMMIDLRSAKLIATTTEVEDVRAMISSRRGNLDLKRFSGKVYGGELSVKATLDDDGGSLKLTSEYTLIDADLERIAKVKEKRWAIGGNIYLSGSVEAQGRSLRGLISSMKGAGVLKIKNGVLNGINPVIFAKALMRVESESELNSIVDGILGEGEMPFGNLDSSYTINNGLVATTDLRFKTQGVTGKTSLVIDLTVFKLDNEWRFSFDDFPNSPPLLVLYTGAINAPDRTFNAEGLRGFLVVKTLKDSVKRLESIEEEARKRLARKKVDVRVKQPDQVVPETGPVVPKKPVGPPDRLKAIVPPVDLSKPVPVN